MDLLKEKLEPEIFNCLISAKLTILELITLNKFRLMQRTDLDEESVNKIVREAATCALKNQFCKASEVPPWRRLSTGCPDLDSILRGGIPLNGITEIYGCSGVGKTQFCLQLALMAQVDETRGGLGKSTVYICTEDVFPNKRLHELAIHFTRKYKSDLNFEDNLYVQYVADLEKLNIALFQDLQKLLQVKQIGLLVIDSIAGVFRSENEDVNYANRGQDFVNLAARLSNLADKYNFAVVTTNQVTDNIQDGTTEPCLGLSWSNLVTCRFSITRNEFDPEREFHVVFAPDLPENTRNFLITAEGIVGQAVQ